MWRFVALVGGILAVSTAVGLIWNIGIGGALLIVAESIVIARRALISIDKRAKSPEPKITLDTVR